MKILDKELNFNFNDADDMEKLENAIEKTRKKLNALKIEGKTMSAVIKEVCNCVFNCFDEIFGENVSKDIFGNRYNLDICIDAFENLCNAKVEQDNSFEQRIKNFETKYSPNRATRRTKK